MSNCKPFPPFVQQSGLLAPFTQQNCPFPPFEQQSALSAPFKQQNGPDPPEGHFEFKKIS